MVTAQHPCPSSWTSCLGLRVLPLSSDGQSVSSRTLPDPIRSRQGRAFRLVRRRPIPSSTSIVHDLTKVPSTEPREESEGTFFLNRL